MELLLNTKIKWQLIRKMLSRHQSSGRACVFFSKSTTATNLIGVRALKRRRTQFSCQPLIHIVTHETKSWVYSLIFLQNWYKVGVLEVAGSVQHLVSEEGLFYPCASCTAPGYTTTSCNPPPPHPLRREYSTRTLAGPCILGDTCTAEVVYPVCPGEGYALWQW